MDKKKVQWMSSTCTESDQNDENRPTSYDRACN
jgi:hypothetical protein